MVNSPNVVNKHQNTFIREMLFQQSYKQLKGIDENPHKSMQNMNITSYNMQIC
jgi:hypothetical protein